MSNYADLIERLRAEKVKQVWRGGVGTGYSVKRSSGPTKLDLEAADAISRLEREKAALVEALDSAAARFDHCAEMIAEGFDILGTTRAQHTVKAKHYAIEARQALSRTQEQTA